MFAPYGSCCSYKCQSNFNHNEGEDDDNDVIVVTTNIGTTNSCEPGRINAPARPTRTTSRVACTITTIRFINNIVTKTGYMIPILILLGQVSDVKGEGSLSFLQLNKRPIPYQLLDDGTTYIRNLTNDLQFYGDTISDGILFILALIIPFALQISIAHKWGQKLYDVQYTIIVYIISFVLTAIVTEVIKNYVGYLRPIFYYSCQPSSDYNTCTNNSNISDDGRKSFPSGHASTAFCGLTLLTLYLHNRFGVPSIVSYTIIQVPVSLMSSASFSLVNDNDENDDDTYVVDDQLQQRQQIKVLYTRNPLKYRLYSILSFIGPMGLALFIAVSRIHDNRHFPADVVAGSVLGCSISLFIHSLWWLGNV
jgi:membrane-associated phospholipid phosphatase